MHAHFPSIETQHATLETLQSLIDVNLRNNGFDMFLESQNVATDMGKIVVGKSFSYTTTLADISPDFDPLASRIEEVHEVGVQLSSEKGRSWRMVTVGSSVLSGPIEPFGPGIELDVSQFKLVEHSLALLWQAKQCRMIWNLSKDRLKIDPAG